MKPSLIVLLAWLLATGLGCGYSAQKTTPAQPGTTPAISELVPTSTNAGTAFTMTVNGSNFSSSAAVNFNGTAMTTMYVSANQLMATVPGSADKTSGTVPVTVTNPGTPGGIYGGGTLSETSAAMNFTIN